MIGRYRRSSTGKHADAEGRDIGRCRQCRRRLFRQRKKQGGTIKRRSKQVKLRRKTGIEKKQAGTAHKHAEGDR